MDRGKAKKWDLDEQIARDLKDSDAIINEILFDRCAFDYLNLDDRVLRGLARSGFNKLSFIQKESIPLGRIGVDMVLQARSGSGKTCAYAVIALDSLVPGNSTQVLIVTPTREIAFQVYHVIRLIGIYYEDVKIALVTGGFKVARDVEDIQNAQFVIGTPGRIIQLIELGHLDTSSIRLLILDEADKLFDEQMSSQMAALIARLPEAKQTIAVSATFPNDLKAKVEKYLNDPKIVTAGDEVPFPARNAQFYTIITAEPIYVYKIKTLKKWISYLKFNQMIIFVNTKDSGQKISNDFRYTTDYSCTYMFGDLDQTERFDIYKKFHSQKFKILVTTDLFSRGVDFKNVNAIVNFDLPENRETFIHRVGRAGRFGTDCLTLTLFENGPEELVYQGFAEKLGFQAKVMPNDLVIDNPWAVLDERYKHVELTAYQKIDRMLNPRRFLPPCRNFRPSPHIGIEEDFVNPQPKRRVKPGRHPMLRRNSLMRKHKIYFKKPSYPFGTRLNTEFFDKYFAERWSQPQEFLSSSEEEDEGPPPGGWPGCCGGHIMPGTNRWLSLDEDGKPIIHKFYVYPEVPPKRKFPSTDKTSDKSNGESSSSGQNNSDDIVIPYPVDSE